MRALIGAVIATALLGTACSSGLSLDEYGARLEERAAAYGTENDDLGHQHLVDLEAAIAELQRTHEGEALITAAVEETAARSATLFAAVGDALERFRSDIEEFEEPGIVADEHRAYVEALEGARDGIGSLLTDLADATSFDEIDRALSGSRYADAGPRVEAACAQLERALAGQGIDVDLRCEATR